MRFLFLFVILFGLSSSLVFAYKKIRVSDVKVVSKLVLAAILSLIMCVIVYLGEYT